MITYSGFRDYKRLVVENNVFTTEILDVETEDFTSLHDIVARSIGCHGVEVLYSGGLDSELVLASCITNKIPCTAITMRLLSNGCVLNAHDLYYSEKFCRTNSISQSVVDLDVDKFFNNGDHVSYLEPYKITQPHVATHFWLLNQCTGFPIIGGDYPWPQIQNNTISPFRHHYSYYDQYMRDHHIRGIGNMLSDCLEMSTLLVSHHVNLERSDPVRYNGNQVNISNLKVDMYNQLSGWRFEKRLRSYGWEHAPRALVDLVQLGADLIRRFGSTTSSIVWGKKLADSFGIVPGSNDKFN